MLHRHKHNYINLLIDVFCKVDGSQATKINSLGYGSKLIHKIWHFVQNNILKCVFDHLIFSINLKITKFFAKIIFLLIAKTLF